MAAMGEPSRLRAIARAFAVLSAIALGAVGAFHIVQLARLFGSRIDYPYDLEWMEGGQLYHAHRLLEGAALYQDCSDGFLPFPYPPVHAAVVAAATAVFGNTYLVARLVSVVAFTLATAVLAREVWGDGRPAGRRLVSTLAAVGGIAASFPITGAWYDLVRVDSVYFALLVVGARLTLPPRGRAGAGRREHLSNGRMLACALCLAASVYAKQTAAFFMPWIALYAWWRYGRRGFVLGASTALLCVLPGLWLSWEGDGFFLSMMFEVMGRHPLVEIQAREAAVRTLLFAPPLFVLPVATLWLARRGRLDRDLSFWLGMLLTAAVASIVTTAKVGAFLNNMLTVCVLAWPVSAMVANAMLAATPRHRTRGVVVAGLVGGLAAWHLALLTYEPGRFVPSRKHRESVSALYSVVGSLEGGVIAPGHSYLPILAGHDDVQIHEQGYIDIMGAALERVDVIACFGKLRSRWLILDDASQAHMRALIQLGYRPDSRLPKTARTPVGMYTRPIVLMTRVDDAAIFVERRDPRALFDFEDGSYDGWQIEGDAFAWGPSTALNGFQTPVAGQRGRYFADSFHPTQLDAATGSLVSPPFTIDRSRLGFRVGGGHSVRLAVELIVDGEVVQQTRGAGTNFEILGPTIWDVSSWRGRSAQLRVIDEEPGGWGHIMVDAVELFDLPPSTPPSSDVR